MDARNHGASELCAVVPRRDLRGRYGITVALYHRSVTAPYVAHASKSNSYFVTATYHLLAWFGCGPGRAVVLQFLGWYEMQNTGSVQTSLHRAYIQRRTSIGKANHLGALVNKRR